MVIFDGKYTWDGTKRSHENPISWWPGSYKVKLVNLTDKYSGAIMFKPYICMFSNLGDHLSVSGSTQNFVKKICRDFGLDLKRVLWVEHYPGSPGRMEVLSFKKITRVLDDVFYAVTRRSVRQNELLLIGSVFEEAKHVVPMNH